MNAPCKNCKDRKLGCHYECKEYSEYVVLIESIRKKREYRVDCNGFFIGHYHRINNPAKFCR